MRLLLAHDWLCGYRGGEAVLDAIARTVAPEHETAGLVTMVADGTPLTPALDALPTHPSALQRLPGASGAARRWYMPLYPAAIASLNRRVASLHQAQPLDLIVSTSSAAIKSIRPPPGVPHLCYCHAPARYVWSQADQYAHGSAGRLRSLGLACAKHPYRAWDRRTSRTVTRFLANSTHTAGLIRDAFDREATVLHPPVRTEFFTPPSAARADDAPWLFVAALEPYKRADLAIDAARRSGNSLVICGDGSQRRHLERTAPPNVRFAGRVSDDALLELYRTARLLIFPQVEDFGIIAAEAQAAGCPVVARRAGGALDIVEDGVTGALFDEPSVNGLLEAIGRVPTNADAACAARAGRFAEARFATGMLAQIESVTSEAAQAPAPPTR